MIEPIEINNTKVDLVKLINPENLEIIAIPAYGRDFEDGFNPNEMNLTWRMMNASSLIFFFQLNFSYPEKISPLADAPDRLNINFKGAE